MGRVRTKVSTATITECIMYTVTNNPKDRKEIRQGHHRALLPKTHPRLRNQQAHLR